MNRRTASPCRPTPPVRDASAWYGPALLARGNRLERLDAADIEAASDPGPRIDQTRERLTFLTDSCGLVGLPCPQTARAGGRRPG